MRLRAVFFEDDDARAVAARLARDGFEAVVEREKLAGENDDEDHPWAVLSDAPEFVLEVLVEHYDGWLDRDFPASQPPADHAPPQLDLPDASRRIRGHFTES